MSVHEEACRKFRDEISRPNELLSIILSTHLHIEAEAERLILLKCNKPDRMNSARLSANQKFVLCEALWGDPEGDGLFWPALDRLNILRNEVAHGMDQGRLDKKTRAFVETIAADEKANKGKDLVESLVNCLGYLYTDMCQLENSYPRT